MTVSRWDKLLEQVVSLNPDVRFEELKKILESYGYVMKSPKGGSSHYTFRKDGDNPITIPKHKPIKKVYIKMVKDVIEKGEKVHEEN